MTTTPTSPFEQAVARELRALTAGITIGSGLADATRERCRRRRRARLTVAAAALAVLVFLVPAGLLLHVGGGDGVAPAASSAAAAAHPVGVPIARPPTAAPGVSGPVIGGVTIPWLPTGLTPGGTSVGIATDPRDTRSGVRSYRADFSTTDGPVGFVSLRAEWGPTGTLDEVAERARAGGSSFDSYSRTTVRGHSAIQRGNAAKAEFGFTWIEREGLVLTVEGGTPITFDEIRRVTDRLVVATAPPATPDLDAAVQAAASRALRAGVPAAEAIGAVDAPNAAALIAARTTFAAAFPGFASTAHVRLLATAPRATDRVDIQLSLTFSDPRLQAYSGGPSASTRVFGGEAVRTPTGWKITQNTYCEAVTMICPP
ncbi:hypothetical protein MXD61_18450 [Frankia sp. AgPm24]|uniref:hypothetical protein n=1 Tax=Frankia sp. AgPm24 TaxID=631128 RepID=UPI00200F9D1C|nr:hypothetical protein [Frankia sp. AgPm24]MCK9923823.1 hypothetical protein [Frankia sp. AgPm24]